MKLDEIREHIGYQPVLLGIVALVASAALAMAAGATGEAIAAAEAKDLRDSSPRCCRPGWPTTIS
jgi:electron transport complex protein RnfG